MTASLVLDPLSSVALDAERHVAQGGWDQPLRLFALVSTSDLIAAEPSLREQLAATATPGSLTAVEQEGLTPTSSLTTILGRLAWPPEVAGAALAVERIVVPPDAERDLPEDPTAAVDALASHPSRRDVRLLVAVLRDGSSVCLLRQRDHDRDDRVARGADIAPGLVQALVASLQE